MGRPDNMLKLGFFWFYSRWLQSVNTKFIATIFQKIDPAHLFDALPKSYLKGNMSNERPKTSG